MRLQKRTIEPFDFKPFSTKQKALLHWWEFDDIKKDIIIADGAIRSGKTISMICSFMRFTQTKFSDQSFIIAGKSIESLKKNVITPMRKIIASWGLTDEFNRSSNYIKIGTNTYYLYGANNEASQDTLQGLTSASALADEIALFPESFVNQMIGRCSVEGSKIFCNCNPDNPYHFFKREFIDKTKDKKIAYLHFTMNDNLTLSEEMKNRYRRMYSGVWEKRYIFGEWVCADGIIFPMFKEDIHVIDTSSINCYRYYISIDYGLKHAFVAQLWGEQISKDNKNNTFYLLKEYYFNGDKDKTEVDNELYYRKVVELAGSRKITRLIIDPSALSFKATIKKHRQFSLMDAKNDVREGIENTVTALNERKIFIDKCCKDTIKEFYSYSWDEKACQRGDEKPIKKNDDCMDTLRYFVNTIVCNGKVLGWGEVVKNNIQQPKWD